MHKEFLMGNAAIALGAVAAGVNVVAGYPGTPSTEVLETVAKNRPDDVYVEWSAKEEWSFLSQMILARSLLRPSRIPGIFPDFPSSLALIHHPLRKRMR